ncbi:nucleotidyltransferase family protein [Deinococcus fonticola]|uniref:nucleotidyltransferase family protein n=1 Tax=Deinococcus fonticola TaxID=2528713 RepID=UPI0010752015|nr:nucleotidyltransferase family protein [Deinococcus fonticola]
MTGNVVGVLLAAGRSTRMGQPKQVLPLQGKALVRHAAEAMQAAPYTGRLAVIPAGPLGEQVRDALTGLNFQCTENPDPARGLMSSFRQAARELSGGDLLGVNFVLADMPLLTPNVHRVMIETFLTSGGPEATSVSGVLPLSAYAPLVLAEYGAGEDVVRAPPHLFRADLLPLMLQLPDADHGPRSLVQEYAAQGLAVHFPKNLLLDIDTPGALAQAEEQGWAQL